MEFVVWIHITVGYFSDVLAFTHPAGKIDSEREREEEEEETTRDDKFYENSRHQYGT